MYRLLTDFNDVQDDLVTGLEGYLTGPRPRILHAGDQIRLHDDGEHEVWGVVTGIEDGIVSARIDWSTWGPAGHIRVIPATSRGVRAWWSYCGTPQGVVGNYDNEPEALTAIGAVKEKITA